MLLIGDLRQFKSLFEVFQRSHGVISWALNRVSSDFKCDIIDTLIKVDHF